MKLRKDEEHSINEKSERGPKTNVKNISYSILIFYILSYNCNISTADINDKEENYNTIDKNN